MVLLLGELNVVAISKNDSWRNRPRFNRGERGVSKGGKGMRDKNPYGFFRAPYFPPLVLFLSEAFFLERKKAGKALHVREK